MSVEGDTLYVLEDVLTASAAVSSRVWRVDTTTNQATQVQIPRRPSDPDREAFSGRSPDRVDGISGVEGKGLLLFQYQPQEVLLAPPHGAPSTYLGVGTLGTGQLGKARMYLATTVGMAETDDGRIAFLRGSVVLLADRRGGSTLLAGDRAFSGFRDGRGADASFSGATGLAWDAGRRRLVVADSENHAIRAVTLDGAVTTIAGNGEPGHRDGVGKGARFNMPLAVCVSKEGDVIVADSGNNLIRKIAGDGTVSTVAGTGKSCRILRCGGLQ